MLRAVWRRGIASPCSTPSAVSGRCAEAQCRPGLGDELAAELRAGLRSGDDYVGNGKPQIDWDDRAAREELIDSRARDGFAVLALLDGRELAEAVEQAASLLATVLGQDLETGPTGCSGSRAGWRRIG